MTTDTENPGQDGGDDAQPNDSPELQDAIRSIDAIGENAWGRDDDENTSRGAETDASLQDSPEGDPDAP
jgi:hypothetical protein